MSKINMGKVIVGGIVAGIIMNVIDYLVNGYFMAAQWSEAAKKLNTGVDAMAAGPVASYIIGDFVFGLVIVWVYAAIRPRFGPGAGTAAKVSFAVWAVTTVFSAQMCMLGIYPASLLLTASAAGLAGALAGGYVGGMMYKE